MSALEKMLAQDRAEKLAAETPRDARRFKEITGDHGVGVTGPMPVEQDADERDFLKAAGFNPDEWEIDGPVQYREWDANIGGGEVEKMCYRRFNAVRKTSHRVDVQRLLGLLDDTPEPSKSYGGDATYNVLIGDLQAGKSDGDGTEGIVRRFHETTAAALDEYLWLKNAGRAGPVHIPFLGDCHEGFVSQGGKNAWRTELTLTEQLLLVQRLMLHAIKLFAPHAPKVSVVSVPGNHDDTSRTNPTRFDDSYAVSALETVKDALRLAGDRFDHVRTFVPREDELTVTLDVNGTVIAHAHGHQWTKGKHWDWWKGHAFHRQSDIRHATVLLSGHSHHYRTETNGELQYVMAPAFESRSQWWLNKTGDQGNPGLVTLTTHKGRILSQTFHQGTVAA